MKDIRTYVDTRPAAGGLFRASVIQVASSQDQLQRAEFGLPASTVLREFLGVDEADAEGKALEWVAKRTSR